MKPHSSLHLDSAPMRYLATGKGGSIAWATDAGSRQATVTTMCCPQAISALHANWTLMQCLSRSASATAIVKAHGARPLQRPNLESIDAKAGRSDQIVRLAIEMAAARSPLPQRREPVL